MAAQLQKQPVARPECVEKYLDVKKGILRAVVFKLTEDELEIIVDKEIAPGEPHKNFLECFPDNDIRWCLLDFAYTTTNGGKRNKLAFISWVPDTLTRATHKETVRVKSSGVTLAGALKKDFTDAAFKLQANDYSDLEIQNLLEKMSKFERDPVDAVQW